MTTYGGRGHDKDRRYDRIGMQSEYWQQEPEDANRDPEKQPISNPRAHPTVRPESRIKADYHRSGVYLKRNAVPFHSKPR